MKFASRISGTWNMRAFHEFPILDLASAQSGNGMRRYFPAPVSRRTPCTSSSRYPRPASANASFAILNDTSRREKYLAAASHFRPHALLFNNRHWQESDLTGALDLPLGGLSAPSILRCLRRMPTCRGLTPLCRTSKPRRCPTFCLSSGTFPEIQQWHVFRVP